MQIKATSLHKKVDLRDGCRSLNLTAACPEDAILLAALHNIIVAGGKITIRPSKTAKKMSDTAKGKTEFSFPERQ